MLPLRGLELLELTLLQPTVLQVFSGRGWVERLLVSFCLVFSPALLTGLGAPYLHQELKSTVCTPEKTFRDFPKSNIYGVGRFRSLQLFHLLGFPILLPQSPVPCSQKMLSAQGCVLAPDAKPGFLHGTDPIRLRPRREPQQGGRESWASGLLPLPNQRKPSFTLGGGALQ